jgi:hypothetical protein
LVPRGVLQHEESLEALARLYPLSKHYQGSGTGPIAIKALTHTSNPISGSKGNADKRG